MDKVWFFSDGEKLKKRNIFRQQSTLKLECFVLAVDR